MALQLPGAPHNLSLSVDTGSHSHSLSPSRQTSQQNPVSPSSSAITCPSSSSEPTSPDFKMLDAPQAAPVPSPSHFQDRTNYFPAQQPRAQQQPQTQNAQMPSDPARCPRTERRCGSGTAALIQGSTLIAEAAKRAEMSVLMRDLGDVEL